MDFLVYYAITFQKYIHSFFVGVFYCALSFESPFRSSLQAFHCVKEKRENIQFSVLRFSFHAFSEIARSGNKCNFVANE